MKLEIQQINTDLEQQLLNRAAAGDNESLGRLMQRYSERLVRVVKFRMDDRLRGRLDPADVVQESFLEATKRFDYYLKNRKSSFFLWLRYLTLQKLAELHRHHFGVHARDQRREVSIFKKFYSQTTSAQIASQLLGDHTSPSQAFVRNETKIQIQNALSSMDELDQEVLSLRHFERLSNVEVAETLGIATSAASKRFLRAIQRLKSIVEQYDPNRSSQSL